jgi:hypothetical protein
MPLNRGSLGVAQGLAATYCATMMKRALQVFFAAATGAVILLGAYFAIERDQVRRAAIAEIDASREALRDERKKARKTSRLAVEEGCIRLSADFEVWESYLDKHTRRKLKGLIAKCDKKGEAEVNAEP